MLFVIFLFHVSRAFAPNPTFCIMTNPSSTRSSKNHFGKTDQILGNIGLGFQHAFLTSYFKSISQFQDPFQGNHPSACRVICYIVPFYVRYVIFSKTDQNRRVNICNTCILHHYTGKSGNCSPCTDSSFSDSLKHISNFRLAVVLFRYSDKVCILYHANDGIREKDSIYL